MCNEINLSIIANVALPQSKKKRLYAHVIKNKKSLKGKSSYELKYLNNNNLCNL